MSVQKSKKIKLAFITNNLWSSSRIRGEQLAKATGGVCNKLSIEYGSTIVLIKMWPTNPEALGKFKNIYADMVDSDGCLEEISKYPHVNIIAISALAKQYLECRVTNRVILIPEHHCNFENFIRTRKIVRVVGYVGSKASLDLDVILLARKLKQIDLEFKVLFCDDITVTREDVVNFYKTIDIQICFRLPRILKNMPPEMKNPLKIYNAGSFKIPTVAYPELNYVKECDASFRVAYNLNDLVSKCKELKTEKWLYDKMVDRSYEIAKNHHIDKIVPLYKELTDES